MQHLLYLIDSLSLGGAETIVVNTLNYIKKTHIDIEISIITTVSANGYLSDKLYESVNYQHIDCRNFNFYKGVLSIRKYTAEKNVTLIHSHLFHSIIVGRLVKKRDIKLFETFHNLEYNKDAVYFSWWRVQLDRLTYKKESFSIYVSDDVKQSIEKIRKHNTRFMVLNNFAGEEFQFNYQPTSNNNLKLIAVGNLKRDKNFIYALETFANLKSCSVSLDIYGEGPLRDELEDFIKLNNIKVRLMGRHQMNSDILTTYDAFLMTSLNEGMPISLLEAMNVGLPCILPDHLNVMKEVAQNGALYFTLKDKTALSTIINNLIENKLILINLSNSIFERSRLYAIDTHIARLMELYT